MSTEAGTGADAQARQAIAAQLQQAVDEMRELRAFTVPGPQDDGARVRESLLELRGKLDRAEEIVGNVTALKMSTAVHQKVLEEKAQDAWDRLADSESQRGTRREFEGAEERYARWRVRTHPEYRAARQARNLADACAQAERRVRDAYRGLRDIREELLSILRELQWETHLER